MRRKLKVVPSRLRESSIHTKFRGNLAFWGIIVTRVASFTVCGVLLGVNIASYTQVLLPETQLDACQATKSVIIY
jgi:hypothetical protein